MVASTFGVHSKRVRVAAVNSAGNLKYHPAITGVKSTGPILVIYSIRCFCAVPCLTDDLFYCFYGWWYCYSYRPPLENTWIKYLCIYVYENKERWEVKRAKKYNGSVFNVPSTFLDCETRSRILVDFFFTKVPTTNWMQMQTFSNFQNSTKVSMYEYI